MQCLVVIGFSIVGRFVTMMLSSVSDLFSLEDVVEEDTLLRKDEFDCDGEIEEGGNGVSIEPMSKKIKFVSAHTHLIRDLSIDL